MPAPRSSIVSEGVILAIDNGTQSLRVLAFTSNGELLDKAQVALTNYQSPQAGWMEHEAEGFYDALVAACQLLWSQQKVAPENVRAVVVTTQRATVINLDKDGQPLRPAIIWPDQRRAQINSQRPLLWRVLFRLLKLKPTIDALEQECEFNWIQQNQPEIAEQTEHFLLLSGYLNYRLTGEIADSVGNQVGYIPFDHKTQTWSADTDWKWSCMGVRPSQLPRLVNIGESIGGISEAAAIESGLIAETPVLAGAADKACEVLGSGCFEPTMASISCGTTATVNVCTSNYIEPRPFIPPYPAAIPNYFNAEIQVFRGFWMVSWFKEHFGALETARAQTSAKPPEALFDELLAQTTAGADGLVLQPFWNPGLGEPGPEARGSIIGFTEQHTRAHLYRAIIEGIGYALRAGTEQLERRTKQPITRFRVAGGGSQSDGVMQVLADVLNRPTERQSTYEASGLGAAIIGAVALGDYASYDEAVGKMTSSQSLFTPDPGRAALYESLYQSVYQAQYGRLKPLFTALQSIYHRGS